MYKAFQTIVLRTPMLPFNSIQEYLTTSDVSTLIENKLITEAIYLASPELFHEIKKSIENETILKNERLISTITRYFTRMCTRCTPFGLFAGCSTGTIGEQSITILDNSIIKNTRLDMMFIFGLYQYIIKDKEIQKYSQYKLNTSIYSIGDSYRYIEYLYSHNKRFHKLTSVKKSAFLNKIINGDMKDGRLNKLVDCLIDRDVSVKDAIDYLGELVDSQILVNTMEPNIIGHNPFKNLIMKLEQMPIDKNRYSFLKTIDEKLNKMDDEKSKSEEPIYMYKEIVELIKEKNIPFNEKYLFQVDINKTTVLSVISKRVLREIKSTLFFLNKITPMKINNNLKLFQEAFYTRYGDMEISLLTALDPESGIGYPVSKLKQTANSPLLKGIVLPQEKNSIELSLTRNELMLLNKILDGIRKSQNEIVLFDTDFIDLKDNFQHLPSTLYTIVEVLDEDSECLLLKLNGVGSSAANLLSRFAHTNSQINNLVSEISSFEQKYSKNSILVEIVHQPDDRVGNILCRPHLRDYELTYLGNTDLDDKRILTASDIMISIRENRTVLRSKSLNREVIPKLSNAHNYSISDIPIYRFLCEYERSNTKDFLGIFRYLDHLLKYKPRIKYGNTIICPETWIIEVGSIEHLIKENDRIKLLNNINFWRTNLSIPRHILLLESDNELYVDLESYLSIQTFFSIVKQRHEIRLSEFLFKENKGIVFDNANYVYRNECIISFYNEELV